MHWHALAHVLLLYEMRPWPIYIDNLIHIKLLQATKTKQINKSNSFSLLCKCQFYLSNYFVANNVILQFLFQKNYKQSYVKPIFSKFNIFGGLCHELSFFIH